MYITIDERDRRPVYQQISDEIKVLIARGELTEGSSLPPVRQVAADLGVNLNTIAVAYRQLQRDGLIHVKHGAGAVVISRAVNNKSEESLFAQLQGALTELVLAGLSRSEIVAQVNAVLDGLRVRSQKRSKASDWVPDR